MPELRAYYGYPIFLLVLLGIGGTMVWLFKRNKWI
jgi:Mg2+ and Co2+ transporter CorA